MSGDETTKITTPIKKRGPGDEVTVVHRWETGLTWMAHPEPQMQRASHALLDNDGDVWLVDPLDAEGLDEELDALGPVAGIVVLDCQHGRHAERLADRHDVPIHAPTCLPEDSHAVGGFDRSVEFFDEELADTGFELVWERIREPVWYEGALYHPERRTLIIPDTLMTAHNVEQMGRLEVLPFMRFWPPTELGELDVERILVGHGEPVTDDAQTALEDALAGDYGHPVVATLRMLLRSFPKIPWYAYRDLRN